MKINIVRIKRKGRPKNRWSDMIENDIGRWCVHRVCRKLRLVEVWVEGDQPQIVGRKAKKKKILYI
jgi:hypothetical protein